MALVYRHRRLDNFNIFYVGVGEKIKRAYDLKDRNNHWNNVVAKHGFQVEILAENLDRSTANELEILLISEYGREDLGMGNLVNMTNGGEGCVGRILTNQEKEHLRQCNLGKRHSEESKIKMSGRTITTEMRIKLSKVHSGKTLSSETKLKMSLSKKNIERPPHVKKILNKSKKVINTVTLEIFESAKKVAEMEGWNYGTFICRLNPNKKDKNNTSYRYL